MVMWWLGAICGYGARSGRSKSTVVQRKSSEDTLGLSDDLWFLYGSPSDGMEMVCVTSPIPKQSAQILMIHILEEQAELKEKLVRMYEVKDPNAIFVFKFMTHFGGGKCSIKNAKKFEPKYRLIGNGLDTKIEKSRKQLKEMKNMAKKIRGMKKDQGRRSCQEVSRKCFSFKMCVGYFGVLTFWLLSFYFYFY